MDEEGATELTLDLVLVILELTGELDLEGLEEVNSEEVNSEEVNLKEVNSEEVNLKEVDLTELYSTEELDLTELDEDLITEELKDIHRIRKKQKLHLPYSQQYRLAQ